MLSNSSKYAIKAVLFLAINSCEEKRVFAKDIAVSINAPQPYVAKLLQELSRQNIISSIRGPKGGFYLSEANKNQPLFKVVVAMDGDLRLQSCVLDFKKCNFDKPCPLHHAVHPTKSKFILYLKSTSVLSLMDQFKSGDEYFSIREK